MFTLWSVFYGDGGRYRCTATNTLEGGVQILKATEYAEIIVTRKWRVPHNQVQIQKEQ
jgi:hypothetical protein